MGVPRLFLGCFCPIEFALQAALASVNKSKPFIYKKKPKAPLKHNTDTVESLCENS